MAEMYKRKLLAGPYDKIYLKLFFNLIIKRERGIWRGLERGEMERNREEERKGKKSKKKELEGKR